MPCGSELLGTVQVFGAVLSWRELKRDHSQAWRHQAPTGETDGGFQCQVSHSRQAQNVWWITHRPVPDTAAMQILHWRALSECSERKKRVASQIFGWRQHQLTTRLMPGGASLGQGPGPKGLLLINPKQGRSAKHMHSPPAVSQEPKGLGAARLPRSQQQPQCLSLPPPSPAVPKLKQRRQRNTGMMAHASSKGDEPGKITSLKPACYRVEPCQKKRILKSEHCGKTWWGNRTIPLVWMCTCVWVGMYMCVHIFGGQESTSSVIPQEPCGGYSWLSTWLHLEFAKTQTARHTSEEVVFFFFFSFFFFFFFFFKKREMIGEICIKTSQTREHKSSNWSMHEETSMALVLALGRQSQTDLWVPGQLNLHHVLQAS